MTKKLLSFLLLAFFSLSTLSIFAQGRDADSPFRFGLSVNPLLTWSRTDKNFKPDGVKFGFEYGLNVHYYFFKNVGFETGFYLNHHGAKFVYNRDVITGTGSGSGAVSDTANYRYNYNLNNIYAKIPLALRFRTNQIGPIYLYGNFGVDFSFLVSSKVKFSGRDRNVHTDDKSAVTYAEDSYKISSAPFRIGLFLGGGVEYPISGSFSITAALNYNYGFLNMVRDNLGSSKKPFVTTAGANSYPYVTPDKEDIRTQYLGLNVGVLF